MPGVGREFIPRNRMRLILVWMMRMGHRIQVSVAIFLAALAAIMSSGPRARSLRFWRRPAISARPEVDA
jgi:hypothetical protein